MTKYLVALDIGTTNVRTIVYSDSAEALFLSSENVKILEPETGAAEIEAEQLWSAVCKVRLVIFTYYESRFLLIDTVLMKIQKFLKFLGRLRVTKILIGNL